ncbi:MAG: aminotransferase class I/II-fold pyridoxal phosphate-dependent enzyme, partial [Liquorilactobacillus satsumensis]
EYINKIVSQMQSSKIRSFDEYINQDPQMLKLTVGEPDFKVPEHIKIAAINAINQDKSHYSYFWGISELRQAVAEYYPRKFLMPNYNEQQVVCTVGATEALAATFKTLFNPGEAVLIPQPAYQIYESLAKINQLVPVMVNTESDDFILTSQKIAQAIRTHPNLKFRGVVINDPNNPTGVLYTKQQLVNLVSILRDQQLWIISDEIYGELTFNQRHYSLSYFLPEQTVVINGLSKSHAMTGWRIGFIMGPQKLMSQIVKVHQALVTSPTSIVQYAAVEALTHGKKDSQIMVKAYEARSNYVTNQLIKMNFKVCRPQGAFYVFAKIPKFLNLTGSQFALQLADHFHVGVIPGAAFGDDRYIRISCATSYDQLLIAMQRIKQFCNKNKA